MSSPTQRALAQLRKEGLVAQVVERWNAYAKIRVDLFGIIDVVALGAGFILGVQATTRDNASKHVDKALAEPKLKAWLRAGGRFQVWDFAKTGAAGKRKLWNIRKQAFYIGADEVIFVTDITEKVEHAIQFPANSDASDDQRPAPLPSPRYPSSVVRDVGRRKA